MKKITLLSFILVALFGANFSAKADAPVNLLDQYYFGAESAVETTTALTGWYFPNVTAAGTTYNPQNFFFSTEQAATGTHSVKFYIPDVVAYKAAVASTMEPQGFCGANATTNPAGSLTNLSAGTYTISVKLYVGTDAPSAILTGFGLTGAYVQNSWDLSAISKNQWVTLTKDVTLTANMVNGKTTLKVLKANMPASGSCTVYIDDISIFASTSTAVKTVTDLNCKVYANANALKVESEAGSEVVVMNVAGKKVETVKMTNETIELSTANYVKGIYLVQVTSEGKRTVKKIVI